MPMELPVDKEDNAKHKLRAIIRMRQYEKLMKKQEDEEKDRVMIEDKQILSEEFLKYRGKEMITPKEPYLNSDLYEEEKSVKVENRNPQYRLKRGEKIKAITAK